MASFAERRTLRLGAGLAGALLAVGLVACGNSEAGGGGGGATGAFAPWAAAGTATARAVGSQADAQWDAAVDAARARAADEARREAAGQRRAADQGAVLRGGTARQCTTRPEDRPACALPEGARITPGGGDVDGDGVFEPDEPVGPGYRDPRAYDGGPTSGEVQCEHLRQQGLDC